MNSEVFYTSEAVKDFLVKFGKGPQSKDYEFVAALMLKNFCEKQWGKKCEIGFELKPDYARQLPEIDNPNLTKIAELFRKGIEENTPTDCIIATTGKERKELRFQLKRFGIGRDKKDTRELTEYLNSLNWSYAKSKNALLISLDKGVEVEFPKIKEIFDTKNFPFSKLMFCWMENGLVCVGEIYPQYGMEEYRLDDMVK